MRVTITREGEKSSADVADDLATVTVRGRAYPVKVVATSTAKVELEIAGERVTVAGWPDRYPAPTGPLEIDGERWTVSVELAGPPASHRAATAPAPGGAPAPPAPVSAAAPAGIAVLPPMPGKIVDLRVRDGEKVRRGQILLVLEAMKMRNEIPSPADGTVRGLAVGAGANVRAREPMLYVDPEGSAPA